MNRTSLVQRMATILFAGLVCVALAAAQGQPPATQPTTQPTTAPAGTPLNAKVLEVQGDVQHAALQSDDWKPCAVGDTYPPETVIRTGIRSSVKLQLGDEEPFTALVIDSATKSVIREAYKTQDAKRIRLDVGYGQIRAGVAEGGLKSDFTVESPVATLSKRGTWNFGMFYERGTDRFEVFLLDRGLLDVLNEMTGQHRPVAPHELVTQAMRRWADQAQIQRNIPIVDLLGQGDINLVFNRLENDGLGVLDPGGGRTVLIDLTNSMSQNEFARQLQERFPTVLSSTINAGNKNPREGSFGTGRGDQLLTFMIDQNNPLVTKGQTHPGTYVFRQSALQNWMSNYRGKP